MAQPCSPSPSGRVDLRGRHLRLRRRPSRAARRRPRDRAPASGSPSSAPPDQASRRWPSSCRASTTCRRAPFASTASTCATCRSRRCAARSASSSRRASSSPTPSGRTSPTDDPTPPTRRSPPPPAPPPPTGSSPTCPDGYDTVVGERGLTLSGGQRQRIALARALLTNPEILILDDATSSIDVAVEEQIHGALAELMLDRTTILIAHRRSTLALASRIVVLDEGGVVDTGTHEELMVRCTRYRELLVGPDGGLPEPESVPLVRTDAAWIAPEVIAADLDLGQHANANAGDELDDKLVSALRALPPIVRRAEGRPRPRGAGRPGGRAVPAAQLPHALPDEPVDRVRPRRRSTRS